MNSSEIGYQFYLEALDRLGFCTFKIFGKEEIEQLHALYHRNFSSKKIVQLYATHNSNPVAESLSVSKEIKEIVHDRLQVIFPEYDYFIGHFMVKGAHVSKEFSLHQDWNIVDESRYNNYQVWIPLQLTYPNNGGIFVVPGSHRFFNNYRSGSYGVPLVPSDDKLKSMVTDVIVPPGNVLIYHNALFHASYPNVTGDNRIAVIVNYVQKKASTFYFHKNPEVNSTELYAINGETLITNLPHLEKGIVDKSLELCGSEPICSVKNDAIKADDLVAQYHNKVGEISAAQLKQLHITVDSSLEDKLNEEGYAVIDLLDSTAIDVFKTEYKTRFGNLDRTPGRFTTLQDTDPVTKKQIHNFIIKNVDAPLKKYFKDFVIPVSQFYIKKAFTSGDIDLHADSTLLLNHQLEPHYAIWVALMNVDENNGTLTVIPRSHKIQRALFSASLGGYHNEHTQWLRQFEIPIKLKPGQAIIFDNNLLHNSTANKSSSDRLVFTFRMTHSASQYYSLLCVNPADNNSVEVSEETHNYYMDENWDGNSKKITGKHVGTMLGGVTRVAKEELEKILNLSYS